MQTASQSQSTHDASQMQNNSIFEVDDIDETMEIDFKETDTNSGGLLSDHEKMQQLLMAQYFSQTSREKREKITRKTIIDQLKTLGLQGHNL